MEDLNGYARLAKAVVMADELLEECSKSTVAEAARILAADLAHYQRTYGRRPVDRAALLVNFSKLTEDQAEWMSESLENLLVALVTVHDSERRESAALQ